MLEPYRVESRGVGCPTCTNGEEFDIIGPDGSAQSQSWGDRDDADYICALLNIAHQTGRVSYAQEVVDRLNKGLDQEMKQNAEPEEKAPEPQVASPSAAVPPEGDIPF